MVEVLTRNLLTPSVSVSQRFGTRKSAWRKFFWRAS